MRDLLSSRFTSRRAFREGSAGLLLLLGLGVFGIIFLWLNRYTAAGNTYKAIVEFANAGGMQKGAVVQYRGVKVGSISAIRPRANYVEVELEFFQPNLIIPRDVLIEANQSGLISESVIDITPRTQIPSGITVAKPLDKNCNPQMIVCNGSRLKGQIGISLDQLIRSSTELTTRYSNPEFYKNVNKAVENTSLAAANVAELTRSLTVLSKSFQQQLSSFTATTNTIQRSTNQLTASTTQTLNQINTTANQFGNTAEQFGATAKEIRLTTGQVNKLVNNLDSVLTSNRSALVTTLNNISQTSQQLRSTVNSLSPAVNRVTQGELIKNLESLSANAAQASANLRDVTKNLNNPNNVTLLQQTLDSARVTFENTQKITSDLDELTGDPTFRENLRQLVNGLSGLVSSTQQMHQQVQVAATLESVQATVNQSSVVNPTPKENQKQVVVNTAPTTIKLDSTGKEVPTTIIFSPSSQEKLVKQLREHGETRK